MPAGFYLDREWRFTHVNAEAERLLGRSREDLLGRVIWDDWPAALDSAFEDSYRAAVRTEAGRLRRLLPRTAQRLVRAARLAEPRRVVRVLPRGHRAAADPGRRAEKSAQRLAILAQVSAELAGTLDAQTATAHLPRLVVPALADYCIVTVVDPDGRPRDVGGWHPDPAERALLERYARLRLDAHAGRLARGPRCPGEVAGPQAAGHARPGGRPAPRTCACSTVRRRCAGAAARWAC